MDIIRNPCYEDLQEIYMKYFSFGNLGKDITNKFAIISLTNYLYSKLKLKNPDVTHYSILKKIMNNDSLSTDYLKGIAVVCSDLGYNCTDFPTFNLKDKEIPKKIKELLQDVYPF